MSPLGLSLWELAKHRESGRRRGRAVLRFRGHDEPGARGLSQPVAAAEDSPLSREFKNVRQAEDTSKVQFAHLPETGSRYCMNKMGGVPLPDPVGDGKHNMMQDQAEKKNGV